ncbi:MAG: hypothetical protein IT555_05560 [Acetobacteraceae bacterium]|nr:hypothetical protein [Acetobacteraceae bacterium]
MMRLATPRPHAGAYRPALAGIDLGIAGILAVAVLGGYAGFALRLARGRYMEFYNLAFDFDPPRYVGLLALAEYERGNVKHPLVLLLRPLAWPLLEAGFDAKAASGLVMAGFGAATVAVVFLFLRRLAVARAPAVALAALFAVSGCQMFTAIIPEAYGPAAFGIACVWLLAAWRLEDLRRGRVLRFAVAVFSYGITTTNLMQPLLAEALAWLRNKGLTGRGLRGVVGPLLRYGIVVAVLCAGLTAIVWFDVLRGFLADPVAVAKEVYWQRTKGDRVGLVDVVLRLAGYGVVSPEFSIVRLPEGIAMLDFRAPRFGPLAAAASVLWHLFWLAGAAAMLLRPATRWIGAGLAAALVLNIVFHLDFQYRGSLYLYAAHTHFLVFALGAGLAPALRPGSTAARLYLAAVVLLVGLVGAVNFDRVRGFTAAFDTVEVDCQAPCTEPSR